MFFGKTIQCLTSCFEQKSQSFILLHRLIHNQHRQINICPKVYEELNVLLPTSVMETRLQNCLWLLDPSQHLLICAVEVGVGSVEEEQFKAVQVSINSWDVKGPSARCGICGPLWNFGFYIYFCSEPQELPEDSDISLSSSSQDWRAVVIHAAVRISSSLQQCNHTVQMFPTDCSEERSLGLHIQAVDLDSNTQVYQTSLLCTQPYLKAVELNVLS